MKTISTDQTNKSGWTLTTESIQEQERPYYVGNSTKMYPCGCGVKVDLQDIVYPVLKEASTTFSSSYSNERVDVHIAQGSFSDLKRVIIKETSTSVELQKIAQEIYHFQPQLFLELISADFEGLEPNSLKKEKYEKIFYKKCEFIDALAKIYSENNKEYKVEFGKGHSIKAGGDFVMLDFVKLDPTKNINSAFNHDSIITADSILTHTSLTSVFVSFNNALNDLFSNGVYENIKIYPTYDGSESEIEALKNNMAAFVLFYKMRGVEINLVDQGPLKMNLKIIGATVSGSTDKDNRRFTNLVSGDDIILTKHLGDLSFLSLYRSHYFQNNEKKSLSAQRYSVLQEMTTSNYLIAKMINTYLPRINEAHHPDKNIAFSTDISGPGTDVLFEAAEASRVDLNLLNPIFLNPVSLYFSRKNHTSSTNGPIAISAKPHLLSEITTKLNSMGFVKTWKIGSVI